MFSQACSSSRGVTSLFAGQTRNFGQGIMIRPREKIILRAVKFENDIKKQGISRFNKRFRQWSQHRVRQYRNPLPVSLTADLQMMDGQYLSACVQKAAALNIVLPVISRWLFKIHPSPATNTQTLSFSPN